MEKLFALKKGTEVADRFDGVTIPYVEADNLQHAIQLANGEANLVAIFNQAYRLNLQKDVKSIAQKDDTTIETLRARARDYKPESVRVRDPNAEPKSASSGVIKEAKAAKSALESMLDEEPTLATRYWDRLTPALQAKFAAHAPSSNGAAPAAATAAPAKSKK